MNVAQAILRGMFLVAKWMGLFPFRFENLKDNTMIIEDIWSHRSFWKWFTIILRLVPVWVNIYTYGLWIMQAEIVLSILHYTHLLITTICYLSWIHLQICHNNELINLVNQYLKLYWRVKSLNSRRPARFGGRRELFLIVISLGCQAQEIVFLLGLMEWVNNFGGVPYGIISWASFTYVSLATNMIIRICFIWYLSLSTLYTDLKEKINFEVQFKVETHKLDRKANITQRLKKTISIFKKISYVVISLQSIFNAYLFLSLFNSLMYIVVLSYNMIIDLNLFEFWLSSVIIKILFDVFTLCSVIDEAVNQFRSIRQLTLEILFTDDLKNVSQTVSESLT